MDDVERRPIGLAALVRVMEPGGGGGDDAEAELERDRDAARAGGLEHGPDRRTVHVLHREEVRIVGLAHLVDLRDVLVVERGGEPRLVEEHPHVRALAIGGAQRLEHDVALEPRES